MASTLQTRHVLPILTEKGLRVSRESLAEMSDVLGLRARTTIANWSQRRWSPDEVDLMVMGFKLRRRWNVGPELFQELVEQGPDCADRIVAQMQEALTTFVDALEAARAEGRAETPTTSADSTAAA
jgi:hypothetical protein